MIRIERGSERAGVFRGDRTEPDISCPVMAGAQVTVSEPSAGRVTFVMFREFAGFSA